MKPKVNISQAFQKAFEAMPQKFTGDSFVGKLRKLGLSADEIKYYEKRRVAFYKKNCIALSKRTYEKRNLFSSSKRELNEQSAITLLKSLGYKLQRPTTTFEEI